MTDEFLSYRRSKFSTRLPLERRFTQSHYWLLEEPGGVFRVGFTRFATRMLGEVVEYEFERADGDELEEGDAVGWLEGFKAVTELFAPMNGRFRGANPQLDDLVDRIHVAPYQEAWLYRIEGTPSASCLDAHGYAGFLDETIDRMMGKQEGRGTEE